MQSASDNEPRTSGFIDAITSTIGRILISVIVPITTFVVLWQGFLFLRNTIPNTLAAKAAISLVAIIWGVGGVAVLYVVTNWLIEQLGERLGSPAATICFHRPGDCHFDLVPGIAHRAHLYCQLEESRRQ